jgi:hypothetical protein
MESFDNRFTSQVDFNVIYRLSQGQSINHDNALYIRNYYCYFIEGNKTF